ncbi:hypothetical protein K4L44_10555 [Halosquirtibacter laminarini]|uniref:Uncharacterized protein n=1 Tax=Halosquirtibacter laminarini TaxID=3374600 RepID=A0AC61NQU2_9BACT|nr:hypothetical protein K4L44_10555 [Prolixibacteraceae bacterium]
MKKLTVILFAFLALCSCSKEEEGVPEIPSYVDGFYKLVRVDGPQIHDINCNGIYEDFLTEYTTGENPLDLSRQQNLLFCGRGVNNQGNQQYQFMFRVPGTFEKKEITNPTYSKWECTNWQLRCSMKQPEVRPEDGTICFRWDDLFSGSDHGSIRKVEYRNNMLIMKIISIYYNQKKGFAEPVHLTLIFKYLNSNQDEGLKIVRNTKYVEGDLSEKYIKEFGY